MFKLKHGKNTIGLGGILVIALLLLSCQQLGIGFTNISELLAHPENYAAKEVLVHGKVTSVLQVPFIATKLYSVQDSSGEINVRTSMECPLVGTDVRIKGVIDTVAVIDDKKVGLHLREIERW